MVDKRPSSEVFELGGSDREAANWIARLDADGSVDLRHQFEAWKSQSRLNREAAERLGALWSELDALSDLRPATQISPAFARRPQSTGLNRLRAVRGWAAAAAIAVTLLAGFVVYRVTWSAIPQQFETAVGKQRTITLADGSVVQLNTNSAMEVHFTPGARDIRLIRGEAFFEVAPNHHRPFTVYAGGGAVQALGTAFAVRVDQGDLRVTLTKGTIRLRHAPVARSGAEAASAGAEAILTAKPGRHAEAVVTPAAIERVEVSSQVVAHELSWRQGVLIFDDDPLPSVLADVSRYTDVQIEIADPRLREMQISGYFDTGDVDPMLDALQSGFGVQVRRLGPKRVRLTLPDG